MHKVVIKNKTKFFKRGSFAPELPYQNQAKIWF